MVVNWLLLSVLLSIGLTVVLNLGVRLFPSSIERATRRLAEPVDDGPRVRVFFPWKSMLIASIVLTVVLNILVRR